MTDTPIAILQKAADLGISLGSKRPETLTVEASKPWPRDFAKELRARKPQLLALLQTKGVTWIELFSERIGETIFFCDDPRTKEALTQAGAEPWSIYTKAELQILVKQNRIAPLSHQELRKLHEIRKTFHGRITK